MIQSSGRPYRSRAYGAVTNLGKTSYRTPKDKQISIVFRQVGAGGALTR